MSFGTRATGAVSQRQSPQSYHVAILQLPWYETTSVSVPCGCTGGEHHERCGPCYSLWRCSGSDMLPTNSEANGTDIALRHAIKVLPTDTLMQTVRQVIKQPPATNLDKQRVSLRYSMLKARTV